MRVIATLFALSFAFMGLSCGVASAQPAVPHNFSSMAPADEYFGRQKESILEIRNRLDAFDRRSDDEMLEPGTVHALDDLQDAIRDWQRKYPNDPWLPASLRRLSRDYERAGSASTQTQTQDDGAVPQAVSVEGTVVDAESGQPIVGAVVIVASDDGSIDMSTAPFGTTSDDGSFVISDAPATSLQLVVQPPEGSGYAPYSFDVDGTSGDVDAGVIRLSIQ